MCTLTRVNNKYLGPYIKHFLRWQCFTILQRKPDTDIYKSLLAWAILVQKSTRKPAKTYPHHERMMEIMIFLLPMTIQWSGLHFVVLNMTGSLLVLKFLFSHSSSTMVAYSLSFSLLSALRGVCMVLKIRGDSGSHVASLGMLSDSRTVHTFKKYTHTQIGYNCVPTVAF